jgi:hypothetical protein
MEKVEELKKHLRRGNVYRRADLARWSKSVDRHLEQLVSEGTLEKLAPGLYHYPKVSAFGKVPPEDAALVRSFLKDDRFLLTTPNAYNSLGVGTTQLYNRKTVYNHKRHGDFELGGKKFSFRMKPHFPKKPTPEFLLVDLVNNIEELAEDRKALMEQVAAKAQRLDPVKLRKSVSAYGGTRAKKLFTPLLRTA